MTQQNPLRILVVDDDPDIRTSLATAFGLEGHIVETAVDGNGALRVHPSFEPDVVVLDLMMAGRSGIGFCRAVRAAGDRTPILMLTARDAVDDRVEGLDAGADDYVTKPFALAELFARVRALARRLEPPPGASGRSDAIPGVILDASSRVVHVNGETIQLRAIETAILETLLDHPGQTITRDQLADAVWGRDWTPHSNVIEVAISSLRAKLEAGGRPRCIHTVRGLGYRLSKS
ncbi:response regulator transcription factor [Plantibacter sp. YIM 135347]|uniref:response regulator transcription factor n=1 Tax=Plantibacter sp. YIM 135347 TaxID=3423919 RepID=UPI003D345E8C